MIKNIAKGKNMTNPVKFFIFALIGVVLTLSGLGCSTNFESSQKGQADSSSKPADGIIRSDSGGEVTIDVEWVSTDDASLIFHIVMNTHVVDLDNYDLAELVILRDDAGNEYNPSSWDSAPGGHHRQGVIHFPVPLSLSQGTADYIEMVIHDIAGIDERVLKWDL
ncbi:MAG: hypothetical protein V3R96_00465 [Dehalococcoidales bacterium]